MSFADSGKKTDSVPLKAGTISTIAEVGPAPAAGYGLIACNIMLHLASVKPVKFDYWLVRVKENNPTCYNSDTFPGGEDDFFRWPVWMGAIVKGESYRWVVRLEKGLTGSLEVRYAKGHLI